MTKPVLVAARAAASNAAQFCTEPPRFAPQPHKNVADETLEELQRCLNEQIRQLAAAPEFANKGLISNCAKVALMLVAQLAVRKSRT
jgi:hypothetical protein